MDDKPLCSFGDCNRPAGKSGLCALHRLQLRAGKPLAPVGRREPGPCKADGCDRLAEKNGYCDTHYRAKRKGKLGTVRPMQTKECAFGGCTRPAAKDYCPAHLRQRREQGRMKPLQDRKR